MAKSQEYWQKRFDQVEQAANDKSVKHIRQMEKKYNAAMRDIDQKINSWYQRIADNNEVSMTEAKKLLTTSELKEFKWTVKDYIKAGEQNALDQRWMKELENASAKFHINRLEALKLDCRQAVEMAMGDGQQTMYDLLGDVYKDTYYRSMFEVQKGFGVGFDVGKVDDKQLNKLLGKPWSVDGRNFSENIWTNKKKLINTLDQELNRMILTGTSPQKTIQSIEKAMNTSRYAASRLVLSEQAYFTTIAQKDTYGDLDVEEYEIVATLDGKTCEDCGGYDVQHFPVKDMQPGINCPPFHPNCRCTTCPFFDDEFSSGGQRATRNENGDTVYVKDMTYTQWKNEFVNNTSTSGLAAGNNQNEPRPHPKPVTLEHIDFNNKDEVQSTLGKYEKVIANSDIENAIVITTNGDVIQCFGDKESVYPDVDLGELLEGAYITHNHPKGSLNEYSFSNTDISLFMDSKAAVLRGTDERYTYILSRNTNEIDEHMSLFELTEFDARHEHVIDIAKRYGIGW